MCSDSVREDPTCREDSAERHPLQGTSHDPRQKVPPEDIQVSWELTDNDFGNYQNYNIRGGKCTKLDKKVCSRECNVTVNGLLHIF